MLMELLRKFASYPCFPLRNEATLSTRTEFSYVLSVIRSALSPASSVSLCNKQKLLAQNSALG